MSVKPNNDQRIPWPTCSSETVFAYSFCLWPVETWGFERPLFDAFRMMNRRIEMEFTEEEFQNFRSALNRDGFSLRDIERVPSLRPQTVD